MYPDTPLDRMFDHVTVTVVELRSDPGGHLGRLDVGLSAGLTRLSRPPSPPKLGFYLRPITVDDCQSLLITVTLEFLRDSSVNLYPKTSLLFITDHKISDFDFLVPLGNHLSFPRENETIVTVTYSVTKIAPQESSRHSGS